MQTILGAGGAIGTDLAKELSAYTKEIRIVSRSPKAVNQSDTLFPADLTQPDQVDKAIEGSETVYVVIGFPYKASVWEKLWPPFIKSVVESCKKHLSKLVFFDNIYMYDPDYLNGMTEETPMRPVSRKGKVREAVAREILQVMEGNEIDALIARAPDFLGLHNSVIGEGVIKNMKKGKKANWFGDLKKIHNFIYTPDAAKATAILGNSDKASNQVWHLPTDRTPLTGEDWIKMTAELTGTGTSATVLKSSMMGILGLFIPVLKEMKEMAYQYERDYLFDSSKFEKEFDFKPTPAKEALVSLVSRV